MNLIYPFEQGTVKLFRHNNRDAFGFITRSSRSEIFFHASHGYSSLYFDKDGDLRSKSAPGNITPKPDDTVFFIPFQEPEGGKWKADPWTTEQCFELCLREKLEAHNKILDWEYHLLASGSDTIVQGTLRSFIAEGLLRNSDPEDPHRFARKCDASEQFECCGDPRKHPDALGRICRIVWKERHNQRRYSRRT